MATGPVEDQAPLVLGVVISMLALGGIFIVARVISRTLIKPQFGWDDGLIVVTWFIILGYAIAMSIAVDRGYGKHIYDLTPEQYMSTVQAEVIGQVFAISSFPTGKASIAYLLLRIFPGTKLRWFLWIMVALNAIFFYCDAIFILVQCQPVEFQWDRSIPGGKCWNPSIIVNWGYLTGVTGAASDFMLAILPWFYIGKLNIGLKEKISIGLVMSTGIFATACSILKIYYTSTLGPRTDYSFDTVPLVVWSCVELASINVAACIPTLRPLYLWVRGTDPQSSGTKPPSYGVGGSGIITIGSKRFGKLGNSSRSHLDTCDELDDRNIYQFRTFDVSVEDRRSGRTGSPEAAGAAVTAHHAV